jgi:predicted PurR-regulated permease PerM
VAPDRRYVLGGLLVLLSLLATVVLLNVVATVFFAVTVAYLLAPLRTRLHDRGISQWWASALATAAGFVGTVAVFAPLVVVLVLRFESLVALLELIPDSVTLVAFGIEYTVTFDTALAVVVARLSDIAAQFVTSAPVLLIKLTLFAFVVFALLLREDATRRAVLAIVPPSYRETAKALDRRTRETLFAIYVLQAATALGTFLIALPVFMLLGYEFPVTLATVAAVLQFLPIVGPSILLFGLGIYHFAVGEVLQAVLIVVAGGFFIAWLPDILIRPRLARETTNLPGSLYFVGFVGGLLSLGPIGVIAGPLVVALVVEVAALLSAEMNTVAVGEDEEAESGEGAVAVGESEAEQSEGGEVGESSAS